MPPEPRAGETALHADPRFDFAWRRAPSARADRPLLIAVHDSNRDSVATRDAFAALADARDISILAPHFLAGAVSPAISDGYKFLREPGADYVGLLEAMLDAFAAAYPFDRQRVFMFGFSGGAQFVHRYALVAASRLAGAVVAAPGNVTLLDDALPWWPGIGGMAAALGQPLDRAGLVRLPMHFLVGGADLAEGLVMRGPADPYHSPFEAVAGSTRLERTQHLAESFHRAGVPASFARLEGTGHELHPIASAAAAYLAPLLA